eukprot:TRINITY_DN34229_c0_g1_i1.p1 TRINITY_DN34229_c0_g1~~TRINITY_DN34229_c0_g1_i1.p1  ORF type:complete len:173 (-),score=61.29 TRINITY_DN34229_c0_g1_i1:52-570(-)
MKIFKDCFSDDEMSSDAFPYTEVDGIVYRVETKQINKTIGGNFDIGANASEEEATDDVDGDSVVQVNNLIESHRLVETSYDKKAYMGHIKAYMGRIVKYLKENGASDDKVAAFQKAAAGFVKDKILGKFDDFRFFTGESMDPEAMVALMFYEGENPNPFFYFWKDGIKEIKY